MDEDARFGADGVSTEVADQLIGNLSHQARNRLRILG
jgi:hypothetical protein